MMRPLSAARGLTGPIGVSNGSRAERRRVIDRQILRRGVLVGDRELDRRIQRRRVHAGLGGRRALPVEAVGIIAALRTGGRRPRHETHHAGHSVQHDAPSWRPV